MKAGPTITEPTIAYDEGTGDVYMLELPESEADLGKPVMCVKIGQLEAGLSQDEFRAQMLEVIKDSRDLGWLSK